TVDRESERGEGQAPSGPIAQEAARSEALFSANARRRVVAPIYRVDGEITGDPRHELVVGQCARDRERFDEVAIVGDGVGKAAPPEPLDVRLRVGVPLAQGKQLRRVSLTRGCVALGPRKLAPAHQRFSCDSGLTVADRKSQRRVDELTASPDWAVAGE